MIEHKTGDLFAENAEAIVNAVNCVGVMGRGIALQFKKAFPENFKAYAKACEHEKVRPGRMFVFKTGRRDNPRYIINFPTKRHWRGKSRMEDIESGLEDLVRVIKKNKIQSIAVPALGCALGGLDWTEVRMRITKSFEALEGVQVILFDPMSAPGAESLIRHRRPPKMTPSRAALVKLMDRYLSGLLDPFVSLLEAHKLMYFMQEAGEPLRLNYEKHKYGPYATNLRHVLNEIEGHMIVGHAGGEDDSYRRFTLKPDALGQAETFLEARSETQAHFKEVSDLIEGFESPLGLELLSTVHWVASEGQCLSPADVVAGVYAWGEQKRRFSERQINLTLDRLIRKGWLGDKREAAAWSGVGFGGRDRSVLQSRHE